MKRAKASYYKTKLVNSDNDMKKTWNVVTDIMGCDKKTNSIAELVINDVLCNDSVSIVNHANQYFTSIGSDLGRNFIDSSHYLSYFTETTSNTFKFESITLENLAEVVKSLNDASPGYDDLPLSIYKNNFDALSGTLLSICNKSLEQGKFPDQLKIAKITPIIKSGERTCITNYRPISVLTSLSKIVEKIVILQLTEYLNAEQILTPRQFGFRRGLSTENALHALFTDIYEAFSNNKIAVGILLDLSKAFDTVNHRILLHKLQLYGIRGAAYLWFESYFKNRFQYVSMSGVCSDRLEINCGVPQGSIVGPILFVLYMNDIIRSSTLLKFTMYADDTSLIFDTDRLDLSISVINCELQKVSRWLYHNHLTLNVTKTKYMVFHKPKTVLPGTYPPLCIGDNLLERVFHGRCLGVSLDPSLRFNLQVQAVAKKVSKFVPIIYKIRGILNEKCLRTIYFSLVYPH